MEEIPFDEIFQIIKSTSDIESSWVDLLALCNKVQPNDLWSSLNKVNPKKDLKIAEKNFRQFIDGIEIYSGPMGIYLGLDTLNMSGFSGFNVEVGFNKNANLMDKELAWVWECERNYYRFLIPGLKYMSKEYDKKKYSDINFFAEYVLFLGYSGLIFTHMLMNSTLESDWAAAWGYHDGDIGILCKDTGSGFEKVASI